MEFRYHNCDVVVIEDEGIFLTDIAFGEAVLYESVEAPSESAARQQAIQLIDLFIGDLPPALSYKHYNDQEDDDY